jgi:hypothetical protein
LAARTRVRENPPSPSSLAAASRRPTTTGEKGGRQEAQRAGLLLAFNHRSTGIKPDGGVGRNQAPQCPPASAELISVVRRMDRQKPPRRKPSSPALQIGALPRPTWRGQSDAKQPRQAARSRFGIPPPPNRDRAGWRRRVKSFSRAPLRPFRKKKVPAPSDTVTPSNTHAIGQPMRPWHRALKHDSRRVKWFRPKLLEVPAWQNNRR